MELEINNREAINNYIKSPKCHRHSVITLIMLFPFIFIINIFIINYGLDTINNSFFCRKFGHVCLDTREINYNKFNESYYKELIKNIKIDWYKDYATQISI